MNCPNCNAKLQVKVTQNYGWEVERIRYCPRCRRYFKTMEKIDEKYFDSQDSKDKNSYKGAL